MKIRLLTTVAAVLIAASALSINASALYSYVDTAEIYTNSEEMSVSAEETKWYYQINDNGVKQKRLWSITNAKWLTEWIDC